MNHTKTFLIIFSLAIGFLFQHRALAQGNSIPNSVVGNGGEKISSNNHILIGTVGQNSVGTGFSSTSFKHDAGFWVTISTAPASPKNLTAIPGNMQVTLRWDANKEPNLNKYKIYRGESSLAQALIDSVVASSPPDTFYIDTTVTNGRTYYYRINAVGSAGIESGFSNEVSATPYGGPVWYVTTDGSDTDNGSSVSPFATIQRAVDAASDGDSVLVASGTYVERINIDGKAIVVKSTGGTNVTTIDGNKEGRVVKISGTGTNVAVLDGFTIKNGSAVLGGGIYCRNSSAKLSNLILTNNTASYGGGLLASNNDTLTTFTLDITNCTFNSNVADSVGGGLYVINTTVSISDCDVTNNTAKRYAGIVVAGSRAVFTIDSCTVTGNQALWYSAGGGFASSATGIVSNTLFANNEANLDNGGWNPGGAGVSSGASVDFVNCTFVNNTSASGGAGLAAGGGSEASLTSCIFWGNNPDQLGTWVWNDQGGSLTINYSNIPGGSDSVYIENGLSTLTWGDGNIDADPHFVNAANGDYHLLASSPAINAGDPSTTDDDGTRADMGAYPYLNTYSGPDWYVSTTGDDTTGTGAVDDPFASIQAGINFANTGDSVSVAPGTYVENIFFRERDIKVFGELGADSTIIDGNQSGSVVTFGDGDHSNTILSGFTIQNGKWDGPGWGGGGITCFGGSPSLVNLIVRGNTTGTHGGGIYLEGSSSNLANVTISGNTAGISGGGILCYGGSPSLVNVTVNGNSAVAFGGGGISCVASSNPSLVNSILWDNSPQEIYFQGTGGENPDTITISYSDIEGGLDSIVTNDNGTVNWGDGNIDADPLFVDAEKGDFHLRWGSPAIDAGDPASDPDPDGTRADMGAFYYDQTFQPPDPPVGLSYIPEDSSVTVTWSPNTEADLTHYIIYHSLDKIVFDELSTVQKPDTFYSHKTADLSVVNYYKITAVDTADLKSGDSDTLMVSYPIISSSNEEINFGDVNVVKVDTIWMVIYNDGSDTLQVDSIYIAGGDASYFSVGINNGQNIMAGGESQRPKVESSELELEIRNLKFGDEKKIKAKSTRSSGRWSVATVGREKSREGVIHLKENISHREVGLETNKFQISNFNYKESRISNYESYISADMNPGDSLELTITFAPQDMGDFTDQLVIVSDDPTGNDSLTIVLSGTGIAPLITTDVDSVDFGPVRRDSTVFVHFPLTNPGTDTLHISGLTLTTTVFEANVEMIVGPGASKTVTVGFTPDSSGSFLDTLKILSDAFGEPVHTIPLSGEGVAPEIDVTVNELQFGLVRRDSSLTLTFNITSAGTDTLVVYSISVTQAKFEVSPTSAELEPSKSQEVSVTFTPEEPILYQDTLIIVHDDPDKGDISIPLEGQGVKPTVSVEVSDLVFGDVLIARDSVMTFTVSNIGNDTLTIDSIYTTDPAYSVAFADGGGMVSVPDGDAIPGEVKGKSIPGRKLKGFSIDPVHSRSTNLPHSEGKGIWQASNTSSSIKQIPPGESADLDVTFTPQDAGDFPATLTILSDDPDQMQTDIALTGRGISYPVAIYNSNSFGVTTTLGEDVSFDLVISNGGDYSLDYNIVVDATWVTYQWLSPSSESGQVSGHTSDTVMVAVVETGNLEEGSYQGWLYITTNSGPELTSVTDTVTVDLNLLSVSEEITEGTATIPSGNADPVEVTDNQGNSLGIILDFIAGEGGSVDVRLIPTAPPSDTSTGFNDPDNLIMNPIFAHFYWEIFSTIPEGFVVDIIFNYAELPGIDNPSKLRLVRRQNHAGPGVAWNFLSSSPDSVEVNVANQTITAKSQTAFSQWTIATDAGDNSFEDTQAPAITNITVSPTTPGMLDDVIVSAAVTDESSVQSVSLFYLSGGKSSFTKLSMTDDGSGVYSGTIPGSDVTLTGLAYFIQAQDVNGYTDDSDTLFIQVKFPTDALSTNITGSAFSGGFPKNKWRLISIPAELDDDNVNNVIGDEFGGSMSNTTWKTFKWTGSDWADANSFVPSESYWLFQMVSDNVTLSTGTGKSTDLSSTTITVTQGWNLISSPYAFKVSIDVDQGTFYGPLTYGNGGEGWTDVLTELSPWGGYVLYNRTGSSKTIEILPVKSTGGGMAMLASNDINGWKLQLKVEGETYTDIANYIGRIAGANEMLDYFDNPEPPYIESYVSLAMNRPKWGTDIPKFTSDIRSLDEINGTWDLDLYVKGETSPITIIPEFHGELPADMRVVLLDVVTRQTYDLTEGDTSIIIHEYNESFPYPVKVIAGTPDYVSRTVSEILALLPEKVMLAQNYPNPFNPVTHIRYALPKPEHVTLKVYNIVGQEVVTLVSGWRDLGHHEVIWDGRDRFGNNVASGMYFSTLVAGDRVITRKMVLLR